MPCAYQNTEQECQIRRRPFESLPLPKWDGPAKGKKALCFPSRNEIFIDSQFWASLRNVPARMFIYFHECAHLEGAKCEPCADRRAGEWLKWWGISDRSARIGALDTLENRDAVRAQNEIAEGFGIDMPNFPTKSAIGYYKGKAEAITIAEIAKNVWVNVDAAKAFYSALEWAKKNGIQYTVNSSFRDNAKQAELYAKFKNGTGNPADPPGHSSHQMGFSLDISFGSDSQRNKFVTFAETLGIVRNVASERWHFTYLSAWQRHHSKIVAGAGIVLLLLALAVTVK